MENLIHIGDAARKLGVSIDCLKYHERKGAIKPFRNYAGIRYLNNQDYKKLQAMFTPQRQAEEAIHA